MVILIVTYPVPAVKQENKTLSPIFSLHPEKVLRVSVCGMVLFLVQYIKLQVIFVLSKFF